MGCKAMGGHGRCGAGAGANLHKNDTALSFPSLHGDTPLVLSAAWARCLFLNWMRGLHVGRWLGQAVGAAARIGLPSALVLMLAGCGPKTEPQAPAYLQSGIATSMHSNALMDAAFGAQRQQVLPGEVYWQSELPLPQLPTRAHAAAVGASSLQLTGDGVAQAARPGNRWVAVRAREVVRLNENRLAVVIESIPQVALHVGNRQRHASGEVEAVPLYVGVIFFDRVKNTGDQAEQWQTDRLVPYVDAMLMERQAPEVQLYKLDSNRHLLTYVQTVCRKGVCGSWLKGYLLQNDGMAEIFHTRLAGSNARRHADCMRRLQARSRGEVPSAQEVAGMIANLYQGQKAGRLLKTEKKEPHRCYVVQGALYPVSHGGGTADVSIRFNGVVVEADGKQHSVAQTQIFRLNQDRLMQIEGGDNPVPNPELLP